MTPITDVANLSPGVSDNVNFRYPLLNMIQGQTEVQIMILDPFFPLLKENFSFILSYWSFLTFTSYDLVSKSDPT